MGLLDNVNTKAASVVAAALEDRGAVIQASMLEMVNGADGQMLAGLLFLIAIASGVITVAIGGRYLWARYLLIGPPLFFFLTQITVSYAGTTWQVGDATLPEQVKTKALRDVIEGTNGAAGTQVSLFFQFWNVFMSDLSSTILGLLNLTEDGSHLNFITKVERYMDFWDNNFINDKNIQAFIRIALVAECADYYMLKKFMADPHVSDPQKDFYQPYLDDREKVKVFAFEKTPTEKQNELYAFLEENGLKPDRAYTCQELWEGAVDILRNHIKENILLELDRQPADGEKGEWVRNTFYKKLFTETSRAASMTKIYSAVDSNNSGSNQDEVDALVQSRDFSNGLLMATDWVIARSLFHEIWNRDKFADSFQFEGHPGNRATGVGESPMHSDQITTTTNAIQQFNRTEKYQFKGDYVNAALSMPHFQGVLLMLLSASYPFFALAVVLPGRAGAIFTWMGLWAWVKMWDIGFGVVMMIDNILYALFPRGPNLNPGDLKDAGKAWVRIMEVDPNYAQATYYNLIATCLYAVPLATAVFVRGGGRELVNASHSRWMKYSDRLAGSASTFARSLQAQSYAGRMQWEKTQIGMRSAQAAANSPEAKALQKDMAMLSAGIGAMNSNAPGAALGKLGKQFGKGGQDLANAIKGGTAGMQADLQEQLQMKMNQQNSLIDTASANAMNDYTDSASGYWASESAVAAKFFSHDMADGVPERANFNQYLNQRAYNKDAVVEASGDGAKDVATSKLNGVVTAGGAGKGK